MNSYETLTTSRLRALIAESEATMTDLKNELDRREQLKQAHEVANLEHHMQSAELSLKGIRDFLAYLSSDFNNNKHS